MFDKTKNLTEESLVNVMNVTKKAKSYLPPDWCDNEICGCGWRYFWQQSINETNVTDFIVFATNDFLKKLTAMQ